MVVALVVFASALHALTPTGAHDWHWVHVVAAKLYYVPIVLAAAWFRPRMVGGVVAATSLLTVAHVVHDWAGSMMLQTEQLAEVVSFGIVGLVSTALFRRERRARQRTREAHEETLVALAGSLELRESSTAGHSHRVRAYALLLAHEMGCREPAFLANLAEAALLHDVGKIAVPDRVLLKPGPLTPEEWALMRRHPESGAALIGNIASLSPIRELILAHHERFDGLGYPGGHRGDAIPLGARIFGVVDTFDALTTDRPYRKARSWEEAARTIVAARGSQFDPDVVDAFLRVPGESWARTAAATGAGMSRDAEPSRGFALDFETAHPARQSS
jgi:HD-GYP domain-containing protein (c-di-GMP phosphodiesterase class II)